MTDFIRFGDILRTRIHRLPLRFAECIRRTPSVGLTVYAKNVSSTLRSSEAGRRGRRPLPRLSPFSAKPKRRPHFGGEGHSRGAKTDPVFVSSSSENGLKNEACSNPHHPGRGRSTFQASTIGGGGPRQRWKEFGCYFRRSKNVILP